MRKMYFKAITKVADVLIAILFGLFAFCFYVIDGVATLLLLPLSVKCYKELVDNAGAAKVDVCVIDGVADSYERPNSVREFVRNVLLMRLNVTTDERKEIGTKILEAYKKLARV